jgi:hypothetical protein
MGEKVQKSPDSDIEVVEESVVRALTEFNKLHGAEAVADFINLEGSLIVVELSGPFCRTCGFHDYFDDLKIEIERVLGKSLEIAQIDDSGLERFVITYKIKETSDEKEKIS